MSGFQDIFQRIETKYLLDEDQYRMLQVRLKNIAKVDEYGETPILNVYFDTPGYQLINTSLEKPAYKEKLRLRSYGIPKEETETFIEIKKKYKGIVYKRRIKMTYIESMAYLCERHPIKEPSQISREIDYFFRYYEGIRPMMAISYERIAMAGIYDPALRITFDKNIRWRTENLDLGKGNDGRGILQPGQYLMELKIAGAISLELAHIFSELNIRQISFSKYGKAYLDYKYPEYEKEILKEKILEKRLEKKGDIICA